MPDNLSSAVDHTAESPASERAEVCSACHQERSDLLAELGAVAPEAEPNTENPLAEWAKTSFPSLEPAEYVAAAVEAFQTDESQFDPSYDVTTEDPAAIREDIRLLVGQKAAEIRNTSPAAQIEDGVPAKIPAEAGTESPLLVQEAKLEAVNTEARAIEAQRQVMVSGKESRTAEMGQLQKVFNHLRTKGLGTTEALRRVIVQAEHPETKQHLNAILSKVVLLQTALPAKPEVVDRLLRSSGLNLAAATVASSFAGFLEAAETDDKLTEDDRASLRRIIEGGDRQLKTGTDVRNAALATTTDPQTGETVAIHTAENKAEVASGVFTYTETGQNVVLEISEGSLHRQIDVTGLDGVSIGIVAEIMAVAALAEGSAQAGLSNMSTASILTGLPNKALTRSVWPASGKSSPTSSAPATMARFYNPTISASYWKPRCALFRPTVHCSCGKTIPTDIVKTYKRLGWITHRYWKPLAPTPSSMLGRERSAATKFSSTYTAVFPMLFLSLFQTKREPHRRSGYVSI